MKRKKLSLGFVIVFALFGGYNVYLSNSKTKVYTVSATSAYGADHCWH